MFKARTSDMTQGNPTKLLIAFALPMLLGSIFQQMYNITNTVVLGRFVDAEALAAIGATGSTSFLMLALATGMTGGITIVMSQCFGAKNDSAMRKTTVSAIYITLAAGLIVGILSVFAARPLMALLGTPADIIDRSAVYIQITCGFFIAQISYNTAASMLRALGDSKTPLYFLIVSTFINAALDLLFVLVFHLGVVGVAVSTVISQALSAVLCIAYMARRYPMLRFDRQDIRPDWKLIGRIASIGLPMGLQSCLLSIGMMVITSVINSFGSVIVASQTVGSRVEQLVTMIFAQVAFSFSVYSGQNFGARDFARIKQGLKQAFLIVGGLSIISSAVMFLFGRDIILLFIGAGEVQIIQSANELVMIEALFFLPLGLIWLYNSALRGIGDVGVTLLSSFVELGSKILLSIFLSRTFGYIGIWWAAPIGWVLGMIPSVIRFHSGGWKKLADKSLAAEGAPATLPEVPEQ